MSESQRTSVPLWWIPTLYNADPGEREKFEISRNRTMIVWDPEKCAINEEVSIFDFLGPAGEVEESRTMIPERRAQEALVKVP
ncbi:MAG: hypothetical protein RML46_05980 [Anaerolineae bacterium]|nr:DUF2442 domain-containing protein [Anaerolineae bacterium]MDW8068441.1 hypothetical protein [Anaerolineae bacterium]